MRVCTKIIVDELVGTLDSLKKVKSTRKEVEGVIHDLVATLVAFSDRGKHDPVIAAHNGVSFSVSEYEIDTRLIPLLSPNFVQAAVGENSPNMLTNLESKAKEEYQKFFAPRTAIEDGITKFKELEVMSYDEFCSEMGYNSKGIQDVKVGKVLTPGEFITCQSMFFNHFKKSIQELTSVAEHCKPVMLSDVIDNVDNGVKSMATVNDYATLPVTLVNADALYKDYVYSVPNEVYAKEFVNHFMVSIAK